MSTYTITLSSKNQITLPVDILQKLGWQSGQKFSLFIQDKSIVIQTYQDIFDGISAIVNKYSLPKVSPEEAILQTHQSKQNQKYQYVD
jgi:bifunctional DNA-binding transcriptional regulator/antitoxin component of YhaV-PrlF toxin-antitoxin module